MKSCSFLLLQGFFLVAFTYTLAGSPIHCGAHWSLSRTLANGMARTLPSDIQQIICSFGIGPRGDDKFAFVAMTVCKEWAHFVCTVLYRNYLIRNYLSFIDFIKTVTKPSGVLRYGEYIRSIDLTLVNKYGIDMRVSQLIRRCPNIRTMTLGHPTSVQPDTIGLIAKYCRKLHTFNIGGLESWPFMLECDFSGLKQLHTIHFSTTPLMAHSLYTLPTRTLRHVCLEKMDALTVDELRIFLKNRPNIETLAILHCRRLTKDLGTVISSKIGGTLDQLELAGSQITDDNIRRMFQEQGHLSVLRLHRTWITDATLEAIRTGRLFIKHLDISYNKHITNEAVKALFVSFRGRMTLNVSGCDQVDVSL